MFVTFLIVVLMLFRCWAADPKWFYLFHTYTHTHVHEYLKAADACATCKSKFKLESLNWNLNPVQNQMQRQTQNEGLLAAAASSSSFFLTLFALSHTHWANLSPSHTHIYTQVHALQSVFLQVSVCLYVRYVACFILWFFAHLLNTLCVNNFIY